LTSRHMGSVNVTEVLGWPAAVPCSVPRAALGPGTGPALRTTAGSVGRLADGELTAMRAYVPGDDLRRVDWRASARSTDLIVRVPEGRPADVISRVVLDVSPGAHSPESFELALSVAASFLLADDNVDLTLTNGPTTSGTAALDMLARLPAIPRSGRKPRPAPDSSGVPLVDRIIDQMPEQPILIAGPRTDPLLRNLAGLTITVVGATKTKAPIDVDGTVIRRLDDLSTYFPSTK
jgi:hypothetical protein